MRHRSLSQRRTCSAWGDESQSVQHGNNFNSPVKVAYRTSLKLICGILLTSEERRTGGLSVFTMETLKVENGGEGNIVISPQLDGPGTAGWDPF